MIGNLFGPFLGSGNSSASNFNPKPTPANGDNTHNLPTVTAVNNYQDVSNGSSVFGLQTECQYLEKGMRLSPVLSSQPPKLAPTPIRAQPPYAYKEQLVNMAMEGVEKSPRENSHQRYQLDTSAQTGYGFPVVYHLNNKNNTETNNLFTPVSEEYVHHKIVSPPPSRPAAPAPLCALPPSSNPKPELLNLVKGQLPTDSNPYIRLRLVCPAPHPYFYGHERPLRLFELSDFDLHRTLGTGTFGRVQLAFHRPTNRYYAIKILRKHDVRRLQQVTHVLCERALLSQICHPFIVRLYGTFIDPEHLYLLLEYVPGGELFSYLKRVGRLPPTVAKFYAAELVLALEYLHLHQIAYRDLKPENILMDRYGHVKLADFGFAKSMANGNSWTLCGTPEYLAPEIIQNRGHGLAVDWWALGVLIYEMVIGYPPFYGDAPPAIYQKILAGSLTFPEGIDPQVKDLICRLLHPIPEQRLGSTTNPLQDQPSQIKSHPWFSQVDWNLLHRKQLKPPITPKLAHPGDTSNFDVYPEQMYMTEQSTYPCDQSSLFTRSPYPSGIDPKLEEF